MTTTAPRQSGSCLECGAQLSAQWIVDGGPALWVCVWHPTDVYRRHAESVQAAHDDATDPRVNPCPECEEGEVMDDGPWERDTGHQPVRCSDRCGWTG